MKGLICKDYYCLKKEIHMFFGITIGVIVMAVLFTLSSKYGNVAKSVAEMSKEDPLGEELFYQLYRTAIWLVLFIPMAFTGNVVDCFKADKEAGFSKTLFSLPIKPAYIVGSRYIACMLFAVVGFIGSAVAAFCVSQATDQFTFSGLLSVVLTFGAILTADMGIVMMLLYGLGTEKADIIQSVPIIVAIVIMIVYVYGSLGKVPQDEVDAWVLKMGENVNDFLNQNGVLFALAALVILGITYFISVKIVEKRRGKAV